MANVMLLSPQSLCNDFSKKGFLPLSSLLLGLLCVPPRYHVLSVIVFISI